ncbi:Sugar transporter [Nesidiocoris tenuis]|uniref:Sugar transporter n=1 Tax=Nesidiocoris tenuis TaxID=355587 RepID=A0ABN7A5E9_9HEMI|nr:Sugar transporter [Nesidiocoris tenuis]
MAPTNRLQVALDSLAVLSCGMIIAFPAVALPNIEASRLAPTPTQVSLVGCLFYSSILVSSVAIESALEKWGRRKSFLASIASSIVGWLLVWAFNGTVHALIGGFLFLGIGLGSMNPCISVHLAECVNRRWQGSINVMRSALYFTGATLMYAMGSIFQQGDLGKMCIMSSTLPLVVFLLGLFYLRETKAWLQTPPLVDRHATLFGPYAQLWTALKARDDVQGPFYVLNIIAILRQLSGTAVLITYAIHFARKMVPNTNPYAVASVMGVSSVAGCLLVPLLSNHYGRRQTLISSGVAACWTLLVIARLPTLSGFLVVEISSVVLLTLLTLFIVASNIFLFVSQSLVELYPADVRNACSTVSNFNSWVASGFTVVTFPVLLKCLGFQYLLRFYASASVFCVIMTIIGVPHKEPNKLPVESETSGRVSAEGAHQLEMLVPQNRSLAGCSEECAGDTSKPQTLTEANEDSSPFNAQ